jgi:hypothetical protein
MDFTAPVIIGILLVAFGALIMIARRAVRFVFKLMLFGLMLLALLFGAVALWWNGWLGTREPARVNRPAETRRGAAK